MVEHDFVKRVHIAWMPRIHYLPGVYECHCVTVVAAWRDLSAPRRRIPSLLSPLDLGVAHEPLLVGGAVHRNNAAPKQGVSVKRKAR